MSVFFCFLNRIPLKIKLPFAEIERKKKKRKKRKLFSICKILKPRIPFSSKHQIKFKILATELCEEKIYLEFSFVIYAINQINEFMRNQIPKHSFLLLIKISRLVISVGWAQSFYWVVSSSSHV